MWAYPLHPCVLMQCMGLLLMRSAPGHHQQLGSALALLTPGKGAHEQKERKACWACSAPCRGFSHARPAPINSFDVPETAAAELPALHYSPCHAEGDGWVSPSALKLSFRSCQGPSFGFGGESMAASITPATAILA